MDAVNFKHLLADGQLLIYVTNAVSNSIRYLWLQGLVTMTFPFKFLPDRHTCHQFLQYFIL